MNYEILNNKIMDVFLCCAQKDYVKLPFVIRSITDNVHNIGTIFICSPTVINQDLPYSNVKCYMDEDILDLKNVKFMLRPNWIRQQLYKLLQSVTTTEYYLTIDCDTVFIKPINFFDDKGNPIWYYVSDQNHAPYWTFQEKIFGYGKIFEHSFISDMNLLNRKIILEMLDTNGYTIRSFIEKCSEIISPTCYPAEPELYGSYVYRNHPGLYSYVSIKSYCSGKHQDIKEDSLFNTEEIIELLKNLKNSDYTLATMHSWYAERI